MSSSVSQGLQSCLEPCLVEPRVLRLKLAPPRSKPCVPLPDSDPHEPNDNNNNCNKKNNNNKSHDSDNKVQTVGELGGWSFIQALSNNSQSSKQANDKEQVYVHPLVKSSSSKLSEKSLEMCTESLGCETGSDISESSDELSPPSSENAKSRSGEPPRFRDYWVTGKKLKPRCSFPPPLTSISGSAGVQVRPHREGGRLVLKAVAVTACNTYFHAERSHGRLKLRLLQDCCNELGDETVEDKEKINLEEKEHEEEVVGGEKAEGDAEAGENEEQEEDDVDDDDVDDDDDDDNGDESECDCDSAYWGEDMEGNCGNVGGGMGRGKLPRPSRCSEDGSGTKPMYHWGPCWVATS